MNYDDTFHYLASTWLEQQDLNGKSPSEISDMYFKALQEVQKIYDEKYALKKQSQRGRHVINPGIKPDDW